MSKRWFGVLIVLGMAGLAGCAGKPVDSFTLEVDLPAEFRFIGAAYYGPATRQTCTLPRRRGKRPERKIFIARYKPVAERVSFELPLTEVIEGCPTVLRSVEFDIYAKWGKRDTDVGGDIAGFSIRDPSPAEISEMPETGVHELRGRCQWLFRTVGPQHAIRKILTCGSLDAADQSPRFVHRDQLTEKTLRIALTVIDKEEPAVGDNWVVVPGGWKRCRGRSFEDLDAFCNGNTSDFKPIKMPDGRVCDVYPSCK
ncbi:hypothetical protein [Pseudomonas sp. MPB26]|uniref:hypothetical protein n=1 Tax=Pseudomonas sp. MPB26 TaxID=3388491 RepID=UPI003984EEFB